MKRRDFLKLSVLAPAMPSWLAAEPRKRYANDVVPLGSTGIKLSRLAMGTGTIGGGGSSNQTRQLGVDGLADLVWFGYDEGVR